MKAHSPLLVALALAFALTALSCRAWAQYMYLDANGDGTHTQADSLNPTSVPTVVDVYLRTNTNRDGSTVACNSGGEALSIISYVFNLSAAGGAVTYGNFINRRTGMSVALGELNPGNGAYKNGRGGTTQNPPGLYRLATLTITAVSGDPTIEIVALVQGSADLTSFGTSCAGLDGYNTYTLVVDWLDVDGLAGSQSLTGPPQVLAPPAMEGTEGSFLSITASASYPRGDRSVSITPTGFPPGLSLARGRTRSGSATATLSGTPAKGQAGRWTVRWTATDSGDPTRSAVGTTTLTIAAAPLQSTSATGCADSTAALVPIFGWNIPGDGWDIAVGTNGFVYVTDPFSNPSRICRYSLYGGGQMCWTSPGPGEPGRFVQPRWLAWNPINDRLYVSGQAGPPTVAVFSASGSFLFEIKGDSLSTLPGHFAGRPWSVWSAPRS